MRRLAGRAEVYLLTSYIRLHRYAAFAVHGISTNRFVLCSCRGTWFFSQPEQPLRAGGYGIERGAVEVRSS